MTSKDKTGDQLVATIRKSKSGAAARKTAVRSHAGKPAATAPARTAGPDARRAERPSGSRDGYSHGHRVWPD